MANVIAPQAGLRLEIELLGQSVVQIFLFAVHERGQPQAGLGIGTPAVEVEVPACVAVSAIRSVEAHDVEILVLDPNTAEKAALAGARLRGNVKDQAAHFSEEFAVHPLEFVVLLIEAVGIDKNHLQEAVRQVLHGEGKEISNAGENLFALGVGVGQGNEGHAPGEIGAAQKVFVAGRNKSELLIGFEILDVRLDQRRVLTDFLIQMIFVHHYAVDNLIHGARLVRRCGRHGGSGPQPARYQSQYDCY